MKLCVISFRKCWQRDGEWLTGGGFPLQMRGIASLFDETKFLLVEGEPEAGGDTLPKGAQVVRMRAPRGADLRRKISVVARLPYYLRTMMRHCRDADVVHAPLPGDLPLLGILTGRLLGKKLIGRYGGSWYETGQTTWMNRVTRRCMMALAGGPNVMLATGEGQGTPAPSMHWLFATALSEEQVRVCGSGRSSEERSTPVRLVYVGRLSPEKGVEYLLKGFADYIASEGRERATLSLIGDGPDRKRLERLAESCGLPEKVRFLGQLPHSKVLEHLREADFCVLPSLTESFCKARLDAMACGVPVITTAVGFGREIVGADGERGWIVREGDSSSVTEVLRKVLSSQLEWPALRARCRAFAKGRTLEAWVERIGSICAGQWGMRIENGKLR